MTQQHEVLYSRRDAFVSENYKCAIVRKVLSSAFAQTEETGKRSTLQQVGNVLHFFCASTSRECVRKGCCKCYAPVCVHLSSRSH